jgi:hypothetical protein
MHDSFDKPEEMEPRRDSREQDSRFHDDDEIVPADDFESRPHTPPARRKPSRRPPPRRAYYDD